MGECEVGLNEVGDLSFFFSLICLLLGGWCEEASAEEEVGN